MIHDLFARAAHGPSVHVGGRGETGRGETFDSIDPAPRRRWHGGPPLTGSRPNARSRPPAAASTPGNGAPPPRTSAPRSCGGWRT